MIKIIQAHGPRYGLLLNPRKCVVLLGPRLETAVAQEYLTRYRAILKESPIHIAPENATKKSQREVLRKKYGSKLLGTPIGSDDYVNEWMDAKFLSLERELEAYKQLKDCQSEWLALSYCFKNKINYLYRTLDPDLTGKYATRFEDMIKKGLRTVTSFLTYTTYGSMNQSQLGIHLFESID
jgi:hypothetical protein